ncbi:TetR/AcrR family transcriptional regulator [Nocardia sp. NPDC057668]|uniref:TetR/AcrR family transcriptional regulator n=1 Tax=Nocardia sp. NPDC057668 TaxID=3346202 RepID=UPI00366C1FB2
MAIASQVSRERLRPGPSALTREEVLASQQGRLGMAVLHAVAESGYLATTVADITKRAQVSRRTFYELFTGKEECFAYAFDTAMDILHQQLGAVLEPHAQADWQLLVRRSLESYLAILAAEPAAARALHVEALAAGPAFAQRRARMKKIFADRMIRAHALGVDRGELAGAPSPGVVDLLIGGIEDRIRDCLETDGPERLPDLAADLSIAAVALLRAPAR